MRAPNMTEADFVMEGIVHVHERDYGKQPGRSARPSGHVLYPEGQRVQGPLGVLSLGIVKGTTINLIADGPDEEAAIKALVELIDSEFTE